MLLVQARLEVGVNMKMTFPLHVEDEKVIRKVQFQDLVKMPKRESSKTLQQKLFTSHLLTSPENQKKIREADKVARQKEKCVIKKQPLIKNFNCQRQKKKVVCHADKIKARELPSYPVRGRGRGRGRGGPPKL